MPYLIVTSSLVLALLIIRLSLGRLPHPPAPLEFSFAQTAGRKQINADAAEWSVYGGESMLLVADGIGTSTKGRTAALAAADCVTRLFEVCGSTDNPSSFFKQAFNAANGAVLRYVPDGTAGANLLCAVVKEGRLYYALAGDCNLSVFRKGELIPLSEGQTIEVLAEKAFRRDVIRREDALLARQQKRIYNYVGKDDFRDLELFDVPVILKDEDLVVLMTSGLYHFSHTHIMRDILDSGRDCEAMCDAIIGAVERRQLPEQDNATVMVARVRL